MAKLPIRRIYHAVVMAGNKLRTFNYATTGIKGSELNKQVMAQAYERDYKEPWTDDIKVMEIRKV